MSAIAAVRAPARTLIPRAVAWLDATIADGRVRAGWSRASDAAIVLGSAQRVEAGWRPPAPFDLLRRGTGGGAVICDGDYLMLDVALPPSDPRVLHDVTESYRWLADLLLARLAEGGCRDARSLSAAEARAVAPEEREAARAACWAGLGPYEIVDSEGRKLCGLAQRRRRGGMLLQAAMHLAGTRTALADLLPLDPGLRARVRARLGQVATLAEVAPDFEPFAVE
jgi:lipoate-protein ligase A